jgi:hypothetical protein
MLNSADASLISVRDKHVDKRQGRVSLCTWATRLLRAVFEYVIPDGMGWTFNGDPLMSSGAIRVGSRLAQ